MRFPRDQWITDKIDPTWLPDDNDVPDQVPRLYTHQIPGTSTSWTLRPAPCRTSSLTSSRSSMSARLRLVHATTDERSNCVRRLRGLSVAFDQPI